MGNVTFGPAYEKSFLLEVFKLQETIQAIGVDEGKGLNNICFAPMLYPGEKATIDNCLVQSIYGYFQNDMDLFENEYKDEDYLNHLEDCLRLVSKVSVKNEIKMVTIVKVKSNCQFPSPNCMNAIIHPWYGIEICFMD